MDILIIGENLPYHNVKDNLIQICVVIEKDTNYKLGFMALGTFSFSSN